jgi:N-acetylmuramoyl-L-alanine amidase
LQGWRARAATGLSAGNRNNGKNLQFAWQMQKALVRGLGTEDRGVRGARFAVLRDAPMPAVLIEAGFLSHPAEGKKILDAAYRREIAKAIAEGVLAYKRVVER